VDQGIGLPNAVPRTSGAQLAEWARRAEARGFSSLGTIDRLLYDNYEPLTALAAAAAVTERIGLSTSILLAPLRSNAAALAKHALSVQALSGGRLTLGLGLGAREDDYETAGLETQGRGRRFDEMLARMREVWSDERLGPSLHGPPKVAIGGGVDASFVRVARFADGWIATGGIGAEGFAQAAARVREEWEKEGRKGSPRLSALAYFSLGESAEEQAQGYLGDYYAWLGEQIVAGIVAGAAKDEDALRDLSASYEQAGCEEMIWFPCSADAGQVDLLAAALGT
jgi:alkanesulfonate monooxygenase SsuD/methylene tetrahydromethanopterin reductase-like flavin-dependent oxidoreductase (luciferase family)